MGEKKKQRQDEWERVRKPEDPVEAPEAPIDNRSLFEKLQEQKDLKEMQWQEEHAFKNNTFNKALEEDEAQFLDAVDAARCNAERQKALAERAELEEFQKTQQELRERELEERIRAETRTPSAVARQRSTEKPKSSQLKLLAGAVKRKGPAAVVKEVVKVQKVEEQKNGYCVEEAKVENGRALNSNGSAQESPPSKEDGGGGGGLLGLGDYGSDSDSD